MASSCVDAPTLSREKRLSGELRRARVLCYQHDEGVLQRGAPLEVSRGVQNRPKLEVVALQLSCTSESRTGVPGAGVPHQEQRTLGR